MKEIMDARLVSPANEALCIMVVLLETDNGLFHDCPAWGVPTAHVGAGVLP